MSHTSLSGMASQIGLTITALASDGSDFDSAGSAVSFTITSGTTTRVFIVRTNDATVNPTNIPTAQFITGTTNFTHGHLRVDPSASNPENLIATGGNLGDGYQDSTMLSYWGLWS